jgi:3-methyladenine DNA glycosylase AlkD
VPEPPLASLAAVNARIRALANPARAQFVAGYFKTGPGEYGEGDRFLGLTMAQVRSVVRQARTLPLPVVARLLDSPWHEARTVALLVLVSQFQRGAPRERDAIFNLYLRQRQRINNWDLVDVSAAQILGPYLDTPKGRRVRRLLRSASVWDRRMAVIATAWPIRAGRYAATFEAVETLMGDRHDLIHKACGWMLREVGKRDRTAEERFLDRHAVEMPRTMLRYAVERFPPPRRRHYLGLKGERVRQGRDRT